MPSETVKTPLKRKKTVGWEIGMPLANGKFSISSSFSVISRPPITPNTTRSGWNVNPDAMVKFALKPSEIAIFSR